jgi:hypothetical protein
MTQFNEKLKDLRINLEYSPSIPTIKIEETEINLEKLYNSVTSHGGYEEISNQNKWKEITQEFNVQETFENIQTLKAIYYTYLFEYEQVYFFSNSISNFSQKIKKRKNFQMNEIPNLKRKKYFNDYDIELIRKIECSMKLQDSKSLDYVLNEMFSLATCRPYFLIDSIENSLEFLIESFRNIIYSNAFDDIQENFNLIKKKERKIQERSFVCLSTIELLARSDPLLSIQKELLVILNFILKNNFHLDWKKKSLSILISLGKSFVFDVEDSSFIENFYFNLQKLKDENEEYDILVLEVFNSFLSSDYQISKNISFFEKYLNSTLIQHWILNLIDIEKNDFINESVLNLIFHLTKSSSLPFKKNFSNDSFVQILLIFLKSSDVLTQQISALILLNLADVANLNFYENEIALVSFKSSTQVSSILSVLLSGL